MNGTIKSHSLQFLVASVLACALGVPATAARLQPESAKAFDSYAATVEARIDQQHRSTASFIVLAEPRESAMTRLRGGEFIVDDLGGKFPETPGAMMHHWRGTAFVPGATAADFTRLMQDYDRLSQIYQPQMVRSRLVERKGNWFHIAMRLKQHKVITVVMDSEYDVLWGALDPAHGYSISHSTRVSEVADAGTNKERVLPSDDGNGFLWRINTYWSYAEISGGLLIQCESISITRDIPRGLGWIVGPFVQSVPRDSLEFTLKSTRNALESVAASRQQNRGSR